MELIEIAQKQSDIPDVKKPCWCCGDKREVVLATGVNGGMVRVPCPVCSLPLEVLNVSNQRKNDS